MEEAMAAIGIVSAILAITVKLMKIRRLGAQNKSNRDSPVNSQYPLDSYEFKMSGDLKAYWSSNYFRILESGTEQKVNQNRSILSTYLRNQLIHNGSSRIGKEHEGDASNAIIGQQLHFIDFPRALTKAEMLKLRMQSAREAEKKERVEPIPSCPDYLARFVGLIPEEVLAEFGTEEYVNHMRDELQNARLKGKSKLKVILENVYEFTIQAGKSRLRFGFKRRISIK